MRVDIAVTFCIDPHQIYVQCRENTDIIEHITAELQDIYEVCEHVAEWIGHWTQNQKVWGSIPTSGHV